MVVAMVVAMVVPTVVVSAVVLGRTDERGGTRCRAGFRELRREHHREQRREGGERTEWGHGQGAETGSGLHGDWLLGCGRGHVSGGVDTVRHSPSETPPLGRAT